MTDTQTLPSHVGLILDGNRRYAKNRGLPTLEGHRAGYANLKDITKHAVNRGIPFVSAYIFSTENWKRTEEEVKYLMDLALWVAKHEVKEVHKEQIRVRFLGRRDGLSKKLVQAIEDAEELTRENKRGTLALCFNYGGQHEIVDAAKQLLVKGVDPDSLTPELFGQYLYAPDVPPVDLLIRTSGEQRLSNFMLWRIAYAELDFVQKHWPEFSTSDFDSAIERFVTRDRRYGQ